MKSHPATSLFSALLAAAFLTTPANAQPVAEEDAAEVRDAAEQTATLFQTWYFQRVGDEWLPPEESVAYAFTTDSTLRVFDGGELVDEVRVKIEPREGTIGFVDPDNGEVEGIWQYEITGDVLVIRTTDWQEEVVQVVLATTPEGAAEHQRQRALPQDPFSARARGNSTMQMRGMHQAIVTYSQGFNRNNVYPDDFGALLVDDYLSPDYLIAPWSDVEVPEDIDGWSDADKAEWASANASYVFALPGATSFTDTTLVAFFELPLLEGMETIGICYDDNHTDRLPYDEADTLIEAQTGRTLMGWMDHLGREQIAREPEQPADADAYAGVGGAAEHPDGIGGAWYVQRADGEWLSEDEEGRLEFREDGTLHTFTDGEPDTEGVVYTVDEDRGVIRIIDDPGGRNTAFELAYELNDDTLILTFADPEEDATSGLILSRQPEGNEEHQRERAAALPSHPANGVTARSAAMRTQSMSNLRQLCWMIHAHYADNKGVCPDSLGLPYIKGYVEDHAIFLAPWQPDTVPEDWEDLTAEQQAAWLEAHSGYAYVGGESATAAVDGADPDEHALLFELPIYAGTEVIAVAFADGHILAMDYDDADDLIEAQTGRNLMGWMDELGREQLVFEPGAADEDADADDGAMHPDGVGGAWYAQMMEGREWVPTETEYRIEFRDDGTAPFYKDGVQTEGFLLYEVDEDRSVIVLSAPGSDRTSDAHFVQFDDVMILTLDELSGVDIEDRRIILCRRPEGNEDHQRERAAVTPDGDDAAEDAVEDTAEADEPPQHDH